MSERGQIQPCFRPRLISHAALGAGLISAGAGRYRFSRNAFDKAKVRLTRLAAAPPAVRVVGVTPAWIRQIER